MLTRWLKIAVLFATGFLFGVLLEIVLIEKEQFTPLYDKVRQYLANEGESIRIGCLILIRSETTDNLIASEHTWLRKCDDYMAVRVNRIRGKRPEDNNNSATSIWQMSEPRDSCRTQVRIHNVSSRSAWSGLCKSVRLMKSTMDCDWYILTPDSVMILMENLKEYVRGMDSHEGHYLGHAIQHFEADYNSLSAGVLLSRGSVRKLVGRFARDEDCEATGKFWRNEDKYLGKYLNELGIHPQDTRDDKGRGRFHGYNINVLLSPGKLFSNSDYNKKALYPVPKGRNCCSSQLITIDATTSNRIYHHFYYLYKLGIGYGGADNIRGDLNNGSYDWRQFLREEGYNESTIEKVTADEYYHIWAKKISPEALYERMRLEFGSANADD